MAISFNNNSTEIFAIPDNDPDSRVPYSIFTVNIDGDTDIDVISASSGSNTGLVAFHENLGNGSFAAPVTISEDAGATSVTGIDLDNNNVIDGIVFAAQGENRVALSLFDAQNGGFSAQQDISSQVNGAKAVITADLNGDNFDDVIVAAATGNEIVWFANIDDNGTRIIDNTANPIVSLNNLAPSSIAVGDFDGDNAQDNDLVITSTRLDTDGVLGAAVNNGDGTFSLSTISADPVSPSSVFAADIDQTNGLDLIVASEGNDQVLLYKNNGNGTFATPEVLNTPNNGGVYSVFAADLDGDGTNLDIISADFASGDIAVYENLGGGNFASEQVIGNVGSATSVVAADLDGDTYLDIIASSYDNANVVVFQNLEQDQNQPVTVSFSQGDFLVEENNGPAQLILTRTGNLANPSVVSVNVGGGSAVLDTDYQGTFPANVTFAANQTAQTLNVAIIDDADTEGAENVVFDLTTVNNAEIGIQGSTLLTINDDEIPRVTFAQANFRVDEDGGSVQLVLNRSGSDLNIASAVNLNVTGGSANLGEDYQGSFPQTVNFAANEASQTLSVTITDDNNLEGLEDISFSIEAGDGNTAIGDQNTAIVEIRDNESPLVAFSRGDFSVDENNGPAQLILTRGGNGLENASEVSISVGGGSALLDEDYQGNFPITATFAANQVELTVDVPIINDNDLEGAENIVFDLVSDGSVNIGAQGSTILTINDDEDSTGSNLVEIKVTIENLAPANGTFLTPAWVGFHDGTFDLYNLNEPLAPNFAFFEALAEDGNTDPLTNTFTNSSNGAVDATIPGPLGAENGPIDPGETVEVVLTVDANSDLSRYFSYASMVIPSNDFFIANGNPTAHEVFDANGNFLGADFVVLGNEVNDAGTEVNDENPTNTAFFGQQTPNTGMDENGNVTLATGFQPVGNGGILADSRFNGADFTQNGYQVARITVALNDQQSDPSTVAFDGANFTVAEGDGTANLVLTRTGDDLSNPSVVQVGVTGGSATAGEDYQGTFPQSVTFGANEISQTVNVAIIDDNDVEGSETVTFALSSSDNAAIGTQGTTTLTIEDNDTDGSNATLEARETSGVKTFAIGGNNNDVNLKVTLQGVEAAFVNEIGIYVVQPNQTTQDILAGGQVVFSAPNTNSLSLLQSQGLFDSLSRTLTGFAGGQEIGFYLVSNSTSEEVLAGRTGENQVFLGRLNEAANGNGFVVSFEDTDNSGDADFNDVVVRLETTTETPPLGAGSQGQEPLIDLTDETLIGNQVRVSVNPTSDAVFNNVGGLYVVEDPILGTVRDANGNPLNPGDANYVQTVLNQSLVTFDRDSSTSANLNIDQGLFLAPYMIANGVPSQFFSPFSQANADSFDHLAVLGDNIFGFEDLPGLGDADYNDFIFAVQVDVI